MKIILADWDTVYVFDNNLGVFGRRNPPCNAEDKTARWTHRHRSLVHGLLRDSWIRGYPDSWTVHIVRTIEASRYKTQDFGSCPGGTLLCVEGKLGNLDM